MIDDVWSGWQYGGFAYFPKKDVNGNWFWWKDYEYSCCAYFPAFGESFIDYRYRVV